MAVMLITLTDETTYISDTYGVTGDQVEEYWMKPVVAINAWYTVINDSSFINGLQFIYADNLNGSVHGISNLSQFNTNSNIELRQLYFDIDFGDYINEVILHQSDDTQNHM